MPRKPKNEMVAGAFVLCGLAAGLGVILWLGSKDFFEKRQGQAYFYRNHADGPAGLRGGSEVKVGDLLIGRIAGIGDQPDKARTLYVVNLLRNDIKFYADGTADVPFVLVGDTFLTIRNVGDPNSGATTEANPMLITGGLQAITDSVIRATASLDKAAASISLQLDPNVDGTVLAKVHIILDGVREVSGNIACISAAIRRETDSNRAASFLARLVESAAAVGRILHDAEPKISQTLTDVSVTAGHIRRYADANLGALLVRVHDISGEVLRAAQNLAEMSEKARSLVDRNSGNLDEMVQNFVLVSENLKATAAEVRRNPWRLLYKPDEKELNSANILEAARSFSAGAEQLDQTVNHLKAIDPKTASPDDLKKIRDRLQESFEKFTKAEQALLKELGKDK